MPAHPAAPTAGAQLLQHLTDVAIGMNGLHVGLRGRQAEVLCIQQHGPGPRSGDFHTAVQLPLTDQITHAGQAQLHHVVGADLFSLRSVSSTSLETVRFDSNCCHRYDRRDHLDGWGGSGPIHRHQQRLPESLALKRSVSGVPAYQDRSSMADSRASRQGRDSPAALWRRGLPQSGSQSPPPRAARLARARAPTRCGKDLPALALRRTTR